jgi:hypothetical protein
LLHGAHVAFAADDAGGKQPVVQPAQPVLLTRRAAAAGRALHQPQALFHPIQQTPGSAVPRRQIEHGDRSAGAGSLGQHGGAVAGDDEAIGQRQQCAIGIVGFSTRVAMAEGRIAET